MTQHLLPRAPAVGRDAMLKYLRIAVTALGLTACVLLVALWVRSYCYWDNVVWGMTTKQGFTARSQHGRFVLKYIDIRSLPAELNAALFKWHRETHLAGEADRLPASTLGFSLKQQATQLDIGVPYWCPVLVAGALGAASWHRRDWHFSLRTLLIAMTLIAILLATAAYLRWW